MEKIRTSGMMRIICYIMIPIFMLVFIVSFLNEFIAIEYGEIYPEENYIQTEDFAEKYFSCITAQLAKVYSYERDDKWGQGMYTQIGEENIFYQSANFYSGYFNEGLQYIIQNTNTGYVYTNMKITNLEEQRKELKERDVYWGLEKGKISSNIEKINQDNIKYVNGGYGAQYELGRYGEYIVDTSFDVSQMVEAVENSDSLRGIAMMTYKTFGKMRAANSYLLLISIVFIVSMTIFLIWSIGHEKGKAGIALTSLDKIPFEIIMIGAGILLIMLMFLGAAVLNVWLPFSKNLVFSGCIVSYLGIYSVLATVLTTTIRRVKAKRFWRSFYIVQLGGNVIHSLVDKTSTMRKLVFLYVGFLAVCGILLAYRAHEMAVLLLAAFLVGVFYALVQYTKKMSEIELALRDIYEGKKEVYINETELKGLLKRMAIYINDIANGFSNAIEQSLKSERFKTELITNVSHDIKTPLTSIINYVDLLKKEEFENKQIEQYIAILDAKSQRLKKLIEDLMEASKVSSGNVQLHIETIDLKELILQTVGEFQDRLEKRHLKMEVQMLEKSVELQADSRYMYRVVENLFSNVSKYALEGSRVYIDLKQEGNKTIFSIKNISREKLNISADELMQRFVRGDKSRFTEGSGLGLSIAKSLTELQGGTFDIYIDGDLFKVVLGWQIA